jgi:hypothetical protein
MVKKDDNKKYKYKQASEIGKLDRSPLNDEWVDFFDDTYSLPDIDYEIKQNEICLKCQENGADWTKYTSMFKTIEITFFSFGLILTLICLGFACWLLYFSDYVGIINTLKYLDNIRIFSVNYILVSVTMVAFLIEIIAILLDAIKLGLIGIVFRVVNSKTGELEILLLLIIKRLNLRERGLFIWLENSI